MLFLLIHLYNIDDNNNNNNNNNTNKTLNYKKGKVFLSTTSARQYSFRLTHSIQAIAASCFFIYSSYGATSPLIKFNPL